MSSYKLPLFFRIGNRLLNIFAPLIPDKPFLAMKFYFKTGKKLNLTPPIRFNEKLQWLKLYDKHPEYTQLVDKIEAKKHVASLIGEEYIIPTLAIYDVVDEIDFEKLPNQFVIKCSHDSGSIVVCKDKNKLDEAEVKRKLAKGLKKNFVSRTREYPYKYVKPRLIAEEYMEDESGYELKDYKFFCFGGEPRLIQLDFDRFSGHKKNLYTIQWELLPFSFNYSCHPECIFPKPNGLEKMVDIARKLSKGIPFIRVDLYNIKGKIYFGEITFFPASGMGKFQPEEWDYKLGEWLVLPKMQN